MGPVGRPGTSNLSTINQLLYLIGLLGQSSRRGLGFGSAGLWA